MSTEKLGFPGDFILDYFFIINHRGESINITNSVVNLNVYESIHSSHLTGDFTSVEDSSIAAKYLYLSAKDNYMGYLKSSSHRRRLRNLNLNKDVIYCLTPNTSKAIPILKDGKLYNQ